jgi:transposase
MWKTFYKFAKMTKRKERKLFSESFKKAKVALIESGVTSTSQVSKQFDVSYPAVYNWVKKYGKLTRPDKLVIETDSDYKKLLVVQKEKENLERVLGKKQIKLDYYECLIQYITEHYGEDVEKIFLKK